MVAGLLNGYITLYIIDIFFTFLYKFLLPLCHNWTPHRQLKYIANQRGRPAPPLPSFENGR